MNKEMNFVTNALKQMYSLRGPCRKHWYTKKIHAKKHILQTDLFIIRCYQN